jgi:hypothetical protein
MSIIKIDADRVLDGKQVKKHEQLRISQRLMLALIDADGIKTVIKEIQD